MESCFYETIHETDLLHVRFELQDAPAFVFPAHWHEYVEILYLIRGQFSAIVQATEYRLNEGDLIIINSGDLHMTRSNTCTYLLLQISASQMRQYLPDFDTMRFDTIIPCSEQPAPLRALLSEMNEIRQNPSDSYQLLFTSRLYEFLYHLCRSYSHQIPSASLTGSQMDFFGFGPAFPAFVFGSFQSLRGAARIFSFPAQSAAGAHRILPRRAAA